jgi:hypothetical protein
MMQRGETRVENRINRPRFLMVPDLGGTVILNYHLNIPQRISSYCNSFHQAQLANVLFSNLIIQGK